MSEEPKIVVQIDEKAYELRPEEPKLPLYCFRFRIKGKPYVIDLKDVLLGGIYMMLAIVAYNAGQADSIHWSQEIERQCGIGYNFTWGANIMVPQVNASLKLGEDEIVSEANAMNKQQKEYYLPRFSAPDAQGRILFFKSPPKNSIAFLIAPYEKWSVDYAARYLQPVIKNG